MANNDTSFDEGLKRLRAHQMPDDPSNTSIWKWIFIISIIVILLIIIGVVIYVIIRRRKDKKNNGT